MISNIFVISMCVFAIWYTMQDGEIFGKLGNWYDKHLPEGLKPPIFECPVCMVPWYGSVIYFLYVCVYPLGIAALPGFFLEYWPEWVVTIMASTGLNAVINKMFPSDDDDDDDYGQEMDVDDEVDEDVNKKLIELSKKQAA